MTAVQELNERRVDRFTNDAKKVLSYAEEEARLLNHNYIGTEHVLLGLAKIDHPVLRPVFDRFGVNLARVRSAVEFIIGRGDRYYGEDLFLTPKGQRLIQLAEEEADRQRSKDISAEYLAFGLIAEGEGIGSGVLESLGVRPGKLKKEIYAQMLEQPELSFGQLVEQELARVPVHLQTAAVLKVVAMLQGFQTTREPLG